MEKMIIGIFGVTFRMLLRYWAKDSKVLSANIVDVEQFAQQCGLKIWEAKKFNRTIEDFIDTTAENFIEEFGSQIEGEKRKIAIFQQIQEDIEKISISDMQLISAIVNSEDLRNLIMEQSKKERESWSDVEIGTYTNCVRYISKAGMEFVSKLPNFTPKALEVIIKRQEEYHQELYNILTDIHSMTSLMKSVDTTYREYESLYREKVIEKYSKVELIGSGINNARNVTRYDVSSAYVELSCVNENEYEEEIELSQVFSYNNVVWIKGEAGSGKTTFLQWIAVCAARNEYQKIENIRNTIPIIVELRNTRWPITLQDAVNRITSVYGNNCPDGWIMDLLERKRVVLLFDGLDEINQAKRSDVYSFVEDIVERYPYIKVLLTARNSVKDCMNCESVDYEILPMRIDSIKKFIVYWHRSVLRKDAIEKDREIDRLQYNLKNKIVESPPLKALAKNPLLCAMICALNYVNNEQLPEGKMELYEKCCEMLMDARDNQRKIDGNIYEHLPNLNYEKKRKILEELSYWMMNGNVSSEKRDNVIKYLNHLIEDTNILSDKKNEYSAEDVLNYMIDRSGIIREPEEGTIDFIHKTFMEFLAVKTICRNCDWNVLVREACNSNWKETIIMCFREMGKENVSHVLKRMVYESEFRGDDRYILIASLGASNAVFLSNSDIKEQIDKKIEKMIPPRQSDLSEIAQAGTYLLPFLKDSRHYSNDEKQRCLNLIDRIGTEEAIPDILSYVEGNGNIFVKKYALDMLSVFQNSILEEYNVREQLVKILLDLTSEDSIVICEGMINIIGNEKILDKDIEQIEKVKALHFICGVQEESMYIGETDILWYFKGCRKVTLSGNIQNVRFLKQFAYITNLTIKSDSNLSEVIENLRSNNSLISVKNLYIEAAHLGYFYEQDLYSMKNIETFELHCADKNLELNIDNFDYFPKLKKVVIEVNDNLVKDICIQIPVWRGKNDDLEIVVGNIL